MTPANLTRHAKSEWRGFWKTLKEGYDYFELTRQVPTVAVCNRRYLVNVRMASGIDPAKLNPAAACPAFQRPTPSRFTPKPGEQFAEERTVAPGMKMRTAATIESSDAPMMGLTKAPDPWWRKLLPKLDLFGTAGK
jgi:murein L,D-transpeptidase YafK